MKSKTFLHSFGPFALLTTTILAMRPAFSATEEPAISKTAIAAIAESTSAILQGNSARAQAALEALPAKEFQGKDKTHRACMLERYHAKIPVLTQPKLDDAFMRGVLDDYQAYWWSSMAKPSQREEQEAVLLSKLHQRLGASAAQAKTMDLIEPILQGQLEQHGYHVQLGRTPPLRELMV